MGLPEIDISFRSKAVSAIQRSQRGIVALILIDATGTFDTREYKTAADILATDWTTANLDYIKQAFLGTPSKVIVERLDVEDELSVALTRLVGKKWNYLAVPSEDNNTTLSGWIAAERAKGKIFKAVLSNTVADAEGVINFTTEGIVVGSGTYTAAQYTPRIAGILAGLPFTRSSTYYVLPEVVSITESADPDEDIDDGKLILINDGEKIKIGRGVNSFTTTTPEKSAEYKKIKIVEGMDLIREDITTTFGDEFVGKVNNTYDNQVLFFAAANAYLVTLQPTVLDPAGDNRVDVNIDAQRLAWESIGVDTSELTDQQIKEKSFGSKVFVGGSAKFVDGMEDLKFAIAIN
ncbi:phage tail sheath subtilisin-like domain-containing protein [Cohnella cholangitidis]|uniref:Phage tail sheath protein n=1 Tax=Cohnella cholangitidis TaxID=2598458 RepID=A0A7G5C3F7_9BACL|nr:phage tail sheath subtilisin-like domain-containing protein [Cohnella cholangitidis]QMV43741.1 phage tail sheath protein [Cohnella cholangitidis]